jgi:hypothetical protein
MVNQLQGCFGEIPAPPEGMEAAKTDQASIRTKADWEKQNVAPTKARGSHPVIAGTPRTKHLWFRRSLRHCSYSLAMICFAISHYRCDSSSSSINIDVAVRIFPRSSYPEPPVLMRTMWMVHRLRLIRATMQSPSRSSVIGRWTAVS